MKYQCNVEERTAQPVLTVRGRSPVQELPQFLGRAYGAIGAYLGQLGQGPAGPPFAAYYNMDMQDLDVAAGFPVVAPLPERGEIQAGEMAAGMYATCMYTGPYTGLSEAYEALNRFMQEKTLTSTGLVYEFYFGDPNEAPPEQLGTLILFELKEG